MGLGIKITISRVSPKGASMLVRTIDGRTGGVYNVSAPVNQETIKKEVQSAINSARVHAEALRQRQIAEDLAMKDLDAVE